MRLLRTFSLVLLVVALGCAWKSPEEKLVKSTRAAASWIPTLQMAAEKWIANSVPSTFARSTAAAATKEFEKAAKQIAKSRARPELQDRLRRDLRQGQEFANALERAAEDDRPDTIAPSVRTLQPVKDDLDAIEREYGGSW